MVYAIKNLWLEMFLHNVGSMLSIGVEFWDAFQKSGDKVSFLSHLIRQPLQMTLSQMTFLFDM